MSEPIPYLRYLRAPPDADGEEGERDEDDGALHGAVLHQVRDLAHDHRAGVVLRARGGLPLLVLKMGTTDRKELLPKCKMNILSSRV